MIDGDYIAVEDLVDIAGWMVQQGRVPAYLDWDTDAAHDAEAEARAEAVTAMGEGFL